MNKTILCDVDGVVADLLPVWLDRYNDLFDDNLTTRHISQWDMTRFVKPECGNKIYKILLDPSLYNDVQPIRGSQWGINRLRELGYRVVFVSASHAGTVDRKIRWLIEHDFLPKGDVQRDFISAVDKTLIRGDLLIDDALHNIETFPGHTILLNYPYNQSPHVKSVAHTWDEIVYLARKILHG